MNIILVIVIVTGLTNAQDVAEVQNQQQSQQSEAPHHILADPALTDNYDGSFKETYGELNLGRNFFEGDILLTQQQSDYITKSQLSAQPRAMMKDVKSLWEDGEVPFVVADSLRPESKRYIRSAIKEWMDKTCVKLRDRTDSDSDYIEFVYDGGCSSYVGKVGGKQTISVGSDDGSVTCKHGNIVHELAHSLGFFHEHSRPDRDDYIDIKYDNVMPGYERNFRKESLQTIDSRGVDYDYDSVMHYGAYFFSSEKGEKTIKTKRSGVSIGQRVGLSDLDEKQANMLYNCDAKRKKNKVETKATKKSKTPKKSTHLKNAFHSYIKKSSNSLKKAEKKSKKATAKTEIAIEYQTFNQAAAPSQETAQTNPQPALAPAPAQFDAVPVNVPQVTNQGQTAVESANQNAAATTTTNQNTVAATNTASAPAADQNGAPVATTNQNTASAPAAVQNTAAHVAVPANQQNAQVGSTNQQAASLVTSNKTTKPDGLLNDDDLAEENLGQNYFEGDMILSDDQKLFLESLKSGDGQADKRALIKNSTYLWKDRSVYYSFDDSVDETGRKNAEEALQHWAEKTCLQFRKRTEEKDFINFVYEGGCASRVGRGGGVQKLTIGSTELPCKRGNIIHEMGHALGFFHEHSRPDRDEFVKVHADNIMPGYERNFLKFSTRFIDSLNVPYDYGSVMHYGKAFFSKLSGLLPTMTILKESDHEGNEIEIGQRIGLSDLDVLQANLLYKCDGQKRLSDDERDELDMDYDDDPVIREGPCSDTYNAKICNDIKAKGYCPLYPRTLRRACGSTCQLCGIAPPSHVSKKGNLYTKLKLDQFKKTN